MKLTVPDYFQTFHCIAGECPASCCAGWQIVIDDKSLERYGRLKTPFGNRLRNSINWQEKTFLQYDRRCAFLNEENLCDIYIEAGEKMLCRTCKRYPRHIEEFENERELSLSLSCPFVARLLLSRIEPVRFLTKENFREESEEDFDFFLYSALQDCRTAMLQMLQDRTYPIATRLGWVLALAHDVQNRIDHNRIFEIETVIANYEDPEGKKKIIKKLSLYGRSKRTLHRELWHLFEQWEVLDPGWTDYINDLFQFLFDRNHSDEWYTEQWNSMNEFYDVQIETEQLMVYFLYTYLCGAVYDGAAFAKVKMAIVSTVLIQIHEMSRIVMKAVDDSYSIEPSELLELRAETAWRLSRELEHSDPNLEATEKWLNENEAASFENLLHIIIG